ncbi:MAG TPA: hypothetical protein VI336_02295 [Candidatus Saccharimonadales bacterium]|nr:hypothetical protein [Candidatus Saccharimonadales bacterium]
MVEQSSEEENFGESPPAEEQDYQEASKSTADYADYEKPQKPRNPIWKKLGITAAVLVLVAALGAGGYWFYKNRKSDDKTAGTSQTTQSTAPTAEKITTETKKFESASFKLSFDYPGNWAASEDNPEEVTVLSPGVKLKSVDGKDVTGQIYFRIRAKGQPLQGFENGNAVAVLDSQKIAYTNPTQVQRASTYISFLRYADNTQGLDAIYISGDLGYEKDQDILKSDIEKVDPIISIELYLCPDSGCKEISGVYGISEEIWNDEEISGPLTSMLESLVIN